MSQDRAERKRRRVRFVQRYLLNPPVKLVARLGLAPTYVLVETQGRRSGKRRRNVVCMQLDGTTGWVVAEHGRHAGYVANISAHPAVRVCVKRGWRAARAGAVPGDDPVARLESFGRPVHAATVRRMGTELLSLRFDFEDG